MTLSTVCVLVVPDILELSGPIKARFELISGKEFSMLPDGCQVLNMSARIPRKAVPSCSLDE